MLLKLKIIDGRFEYHVECDSERHPEPVEGGIALCGSHISTKLNVTRYFAHLTFCFTQWIFYFN